jgi:hypothetical protein
MKYLYKNYQIVIILCFPLIHLWTYQGMEKKAGVNYQTPSKALCKSYFIQTLQKPMRYTWQSKSNKKI